TTKGGDPPPQAPAVGRCVRAQYVPSNAKIGLRCFHSPAVKSGNSKVWTLLAMDCSGNGVIGLQVMAP
ncbi:hypothetical protein, partial [Stenotrophomonas nematodicola]|uniref:hypothetical protein n=1 Tax=Stenotrophomonas nematodicola TaxID=2656746 RepID=UPI0037365F13